MVWHHCLPPDCTAQAHAILVALVDETLTAFQAVYNGDVVDIDTAQTNAQDRLAQLSVLIDSLLEQLQVLSGLP
jgi:hypothetical protein